MSSTKHSSKGRQLTPADEFAPTTGYTLPAAPQPRKAAPRGEPAKAAHTPGPCPFCQSKQTKLDTSGRGWPHSIRCDNCGAHGPVCKNVKESVKKWNDRTAAELERVKAKLEQAENMLEAQRTEGADQPPQPAKAAQPHWTPEIVAAIYSRGVYPFKDLADAHNAELERVKQQLAIAESCIKNNDAAFETVKQQRDDYEAVAIDLVRQTYGRSYCMDFSLAELTLGKEAASIANAEKEPK